MPCLEVRFNEIIEVGHPGVFPFSLDDDIFEMRDIRTNLRHELDKAEPSPCLWDEAGLGFEMMQYRGHLYPPVQRVHGRHNHPEPGTGIQGNGVLGPVREKDPDTVASLKTEIQERRSQLIDLCLEISVGVSGLAEPDRDAF
jgi:hypothetical protein